MAGDAPNGRPTDDLSQEKKADKALNSLVYAQVDSETRAALLADAQKSITDSLNKNVLNPLINSALIESHNAISSTVNEASKAVSGKTLLDDWKALEQDKAALLSKEWASQTIFGALGAALPYGIAAAGMGVASTKLGGLFKAGGSALQILEARSFHMIAGATIYDGMRKPHEGETRFGNALGGAAGFSVFEAGNRLTAGKTGLTLLASRVMTGSMGGAAQLTGSHLYSRGELPGSEAYAQAMLTGATLNTVLPRMHQELANAFKVPPTGSRGTGKSEQSANTMLRPEPTESGKITGAGDKTVNSTTIYSSPFSEIPGSLTINGEGGSLALPKGNLAIELQSLSATPTFLKPEQVKTPTTSSQTFYALLQSTEPGAAAAVAKALPKLPAAERFDAWKALAESENWDLKDQAVSLLGQLPVEKLPAAFDHVFANASSLLHESHGLVRLGKISSDTPNMQMLSVLNSAELAHQPAIKQALWEQAYASEHGRLAAIAKLDSLPAEIQSSKWNAAWEQATNSNKSNSSLEVELLLGKAKSFPETEIQSVWQKLVQYDRNLRPAEVMPLLARIPEAGESRLNAWRQLISSSESKQQIPDRGAINAIEVLPEHQRTRAWNEAFAAIGQGRVRQFADAIQHLPEESRTSAFDTLIQSGQRLEPWLWRMHTVPARDLPRLIDTISKIKDEIERKDTLISLDMNSLFDKPLSVQTQVAQSVFSKVMNDPVLSDGRTLRKWWAQLPETSKEAELASPNALAARQNQSAPTLRESLAASLPLEGLAKVLIPSNPELAARLAQKHPEAVRQLAANEQRFFADDHHRGNSDFNKMVNAWLESDSLSATTKFVLENKIFEHDTQVLASLSKQVAGSADQSSRASTLEALLAVVKDPNRNAHELAAAIEMAVGIGRADRTTFEHTFAKPLERLLSSNEVEYRARLDLARQIAILQRNGASGALEMRIPDLRLPKVEGLTEAQQTQLRATAEKALQNLDQLQQLLGEGQLGKLFPTVFGEASEGGMVGRPQHSGHKFSVDEHTLLQLRNILDDPRLAMLSEKERIDLLWAGLFHDSGKRPSVTDPGHEWVSANLSWGVLETLAYPPERISRIATLISRHSELSFWPENPPTKALENVDTKRDLAVYYRNPRAPLQLSILNTADIKSLDATASKFLPNVESELAHAERTIRETHAEMAKPVPLLFTALPKNFGLFPMPENFQVLTHTAPDLGNFLRQRASIQSYRSNLSTSVFTREHQKTYQDTNAVAIVTTTPERISTAGPSNLGTGKMVDWKGHVDLSFDSSGLKSQWVAPYEKWLQNSPSSKAPKSLDDMFREITKFDTLQDLQQNGQRELLQAQQKLVETLTRNADGKPLSEHNEVKANNPHIVGVGILSKGRPLSFQDMDPSSFARLLNGQNKPEWLLAPKQNDARAVQIPRSVWGAAQEQGLPIMILDR